MSSKSRNSQEHDAAWGALSIPALFPPREGDTDADGYLGQRSVDHPLVVYAPLPANAHEGQLLELYCNNGLLPVAHTFVTSGDLPHGRLPLILPARYINPDWIDPLVCRINRTGESTAPLRLGVNLETPANKDPDPAQPGHQGLVINLPLDVVISGVSEERAREHIEVLLQPYRHMAAHDCIRLCWGDQQILYWVEPGREGLPVMLQVPYATIMKGQDSKALLVTVQARGFTGNLMDASARWSAPSYVKVYVHSNKLVPPTIEQMDPATAEIELEHLADDDVLAYVFAASNFFEVNDKIHFSWHTTDAQGRAISYSEMRLVNRVGQTYYFTLPNSEARTLGQGHLTASYRLEKRDGVLNSPASCATVQGPITQWPAAKIQSALKEGRLDLDGADLKVTVPYASGWRAGTLVTLVLLRPDPNGAVEYRFSRSAGESRESGQLEFLVPVDELERFKGGLAQLYYEAQEPPLLLGESRRLHLQVGPLEPPMNPPIVANVSGHKLDPDDVPDGIRVTLQDTPVADNTWLHWVGPRARIEIPVPNPGNGQLTVPARFAKDNLGHTVSVYWTHREPGHRVRYSQVLTLLIAQRRSS